MSPFAEKIRTVLGFKRLVSMLEAPPFLLGPVPCVADFAAYHPLWFTRTQVPGLASILHAVPMVLRWMDRIEAFGHGQKQHLSAAEAITVSVAAESFGSEPTVGVLLEATRHRDTLGRDDPRAGVVKVHFPRIGYALRQEGLS